MKYEPCHHACYRLHQIGIHCQQVEKKKSVEPIIYKEKNDDWSTVKASCYTFMKNRHHHYGMDLGKQEELSQKIITLAYSTISKFSDFSSISKTETPVTQELIKIYFWMGPMTSDPQSVIRTILFVNLIHH